MKFVHLFIVLVLAFGLFGCTTTQPKSIENAVQTNTSVEKNIIVGECEQKQGEDKDLCYDRYIEAMQTPSVCEQMPNQSSIDSCYFLAGVEKRDLSVCDKAKNLEPREACYASVGVIRLDSQICGKVTNLSVSGQCYGGIAANTRNLSFCEKLDGLLGSYCYSTVAGMQRNPDICDNIKNKTLKSECQKEVYLNMRCYSDSDCPINSECVNRYCAVLPEFENELTGNDTQQANKTIAKKNDVLSRANPLILDCEESMSNWLSSFWPCENRSESEMLSCYYSLAIANRNSSQCDRAPQDLTRVSCHSLYDNLALLCEAINSPSNKDNCYWNFAECTKKNIFCDQMANENPNKDICYSHLAPYEKDPSACAKISEKTPPLNRPRDHCYWKIAYALNDTSYCAFVSNYSYWASYATLWNFREKCYEMVEPPVGDAG